MLAKGRESYPAPFDVSIWSLVPQQFPLTRRQSVAPSPARPATGETPGTASVSAFHRRSYPIRYTRAAVSWNRRARSSAEYSAVSRLNEFHSTL